MTRAEIESAIRQAAELLMAPGTVHEVRAPKTARYGVVAGYFDDPATLAKAVMGYEGKEGVPGIYLTLNPVNPALLARAANRLVERAKTLSSDTDVTVRQWLLIDCDPSRPAEISATDEEKAAAADVAAEVAWWLGGEGWPDPIWADSGNGWHLLYRVDLPNDDDARELVRQVLSAIADRFDRKPVGGGRYHTADGGIAVTVDQTVFNAARIVKLYGTLSAKGDSTPDRPHRRSGITRVPAVIEAVPLELLQQVAAMAPAPAPKHAPSTAGPRPTVIDGGFDVEAFIKRHNLPVAKSAAWNGGGRKWVLAVCPWNPAHTDNSAWITVQPHGAIAAGCSHNSCSGRTWHDLRAMLEPKQIRPMQVLPSAPVAPSTAGANALKPEEPAPFAPRHDSKIPMNLREMLRTYVLLVGTSDVWDLRRWRQVPLTAIRAAHANEYSAFLKDDRLQRIDIDDLVFDPSGAAPGQLNLWRGLPTTPDPAAPRERMVAHLRWLCGGDDELTHWLTCWLAYPLQNPGAKLHTSVVMRGPQGSGKNILFNAIRRIYGEYGTEIGQEQLNSHYNAWASGKLFVVADEVVTRADLRQVKNRLKSLITSDHLIIENKFVASRREANHLNIVFLSNEDMPVFLEADDRRFCVIDTPTPQSADYYAALAEEARAGGDRGLLHYLLTYDLQGWHPHSKPPETSAKAEIKKLSQSSAEAFLEAWEEGETPLPYCCTTTTDLYTAYRTWAELAGERWRIDTQNQFSARVKRLFPHERKLQPDGTRPYVVYPDGTLYNRERVETFRACLSDYVSQARKVKV